jgi:hypothetical protein
MFSNLILLISLAHAREIVFPALSGYTISDQILLGGYNDPDISAAKFAGLETYANLPYVHCLAGDGKEVEEFDIAVLGAPFDTVSLCVFFRIARDLRGSISLWSGEVRDSVVPRWAYGCGTRWHGWLACCTFLSGLQGECSQRAPQMLRMTCVTQANLILVSGVRPHVKRRLVALR